MEKSAIPGADRLITMIGRRDIKNKVILALVISICMVIILYQWGLIDLMNSVTPATPKITDE